MSTYGEDLFKGAAQYYSKYRPMYPSVLIRYLVNKFQLNGEQNLLDVGCGTGQLTLRFSDWCNRIVGIDLEAEMLQEAERLQKEMRVENADWFNGDLASYHSLHTEPFHLVIMAKSFHWMNRAEVLEGLYNRVTETGGVAIIDEFNPDKEKALWQKKLNEVIERWYGEKRRAGSTTYIPPVKRHEEMIASSPFRLEKHHFASFKREWTIETILGHLYSTSYGSKRFLGDQVAAFEQDLKYELLAIQEDGIFIEDVDLTVNMGLKG